MWLCIYIEYMLYYSQFLHANNYCSDSYSQTKSLQRALQEPEERPQKSRRGGCFGGQVVVVELSFLGDQNKYILSPESQR